MRFFKFLTRKRGQPKVVPEPKLTQESRVNELLARRFVARVRKYRKLSDQENIDLVANIITDNRQPLDYKMIKGTRDKLAEIIVRSIAKKNS